MDLSAIIDEFNRRKAQAGQRLGEMFTLPKKPDNWFEQMQDVQRNAVTTPEQRANIHKELADIAERMAQGMVPPMIRQRDRAMQTDPSAAAQPFTSDEIKQAAPFVTAAAPIAYHGTPHTFDKFDASKIGTGQGAQSYGHGLYFAENPQVAKSYTDAGTMVSPRLRMLLDDNGGDISKVIPSLKKAIASNEAKGVTHDWGSVLKEAEQLKPGNTYQVNIPDQHAARMLDWDKPLREQPKGLMEAINKKLGYDYVKEAPAAKVQDLISVMEMKYGGQGSADFFSSIGIPGIKYLDQGSRGGDPRKIGEAVSILKSFEDKAQRGQDVAKQIEYWTEQVRQAKEGHGTSNFVVFDPAILQDVTRK